MFCNTVFFLINRFIVIILFKGFFLPFTHLFYHQNVSIIIFFFNAFCVYLSVGFNEYSDAEANNNGMDRGGSKFILILIIFNIFILIIIVIFILVIGTLIT